MGRLGPQRVQISEALSTGSIAFRSHDLDVESRSNFSSLRANVCVHAGRWMYEVTLGTSGIQQLGWATLDCAFTNEEGVGDSALSYAFDGKRVKKWNVAAANYGQAWQAGDVIGCCIDLDAQEVSFCRNGVALGAAFGGIADRPGIAYFPAFSLSMGERSAVNFGRWPLRYPVPGFEALDCPTEDMVPAACHMLRALGRVLPALSSVSSPGYDGSAVLACHACLSPLGPLLRDRHVIAGAVVPFLLEQCQSEGGAAALDMMVACFEPADLGHAVVYVMVRMAI